MNITAKIYARWRESYRVAPPAIWMITKTRMMQPVGLAAPMSVPLLKTTKRTLTAAERLSETAIRGL